MAVWDNGQPKPRFDPYEPQTDPEAGVPPPKAIRATFGPDDDQGQSEPEADLWDFDPDVKLPNDAYRGIRRAAAGRSFRRVGLVVGVVLVAAAAVVLALKLGTGTSNPAAGGDSSSVLLPSDLDTGEPTPSGLSATAGPTGVPVNATPAGLPAFAPLTFEAEAGPPTVKRRGADIETLAGASGGKVARFTGGSGDLEIRGVALTSAATYRITLYYASEAAGTAVVSTSNVAPLTVHFAAGSGCCAAAAVDVALPSGQRTITISEVSNGVAIDRVVITRIRP
jgi:hypothetical protein